MNIAIQDHSLSKHAIYFYSQIPPMKPSREQVVDGACKVTRLALSILSFWQAPKTYVGAFLVGAILSGYEYVYLAKGEDLGVPKKGFSLWRIDFLKEHPDGFFYLANVVGLAGCIKLVLPRIFQVGVTLLAIDLGYSEGVLAGGKAIIGLGNFVIKLSERRFQERGQTQETPNLCNDNI